MPLRIMPKETKLFRLKLTRQDYEAIAKVARKEGRCLPESFMQLILMRIASGFMEEERVLYDIKDFRKQGWTWDEISEHMLIPKPRLLAIARAEKIPLKNDRPARKKGVSSIRPARILPKAS